jgi:NAD(P)-dependent dehydrogenase (short-subunit alcohol dehydrogenase family)
MTAIPPFLKNFSLEGKCILLTGGAGLYGRGLTTRLCQAGANLVIASRNLNSLQAIVERETAAGHTISAEQLDLSSQQSIRNVVDKLLDRFGKVDGLVNNAYLRVMKGGPTGPVEQWEESLKANATGLLNITRACGEAMCQAGRGSVVNIGSIMGLIGPNPFLYEGTSMSASPDYFFNKGGMLQLTRYFASYYGSSGVRVNYLSPGGYFNHQDPKFLDRYEKSTMLGRMANDDDLAGAVIFLLSDASSYITGANLPVDGGYTAK